MRRFGEATFITHAHEPKLTYASAPLRLVVFYSFLPLSLSNSHLDAVRAIAFHPTELCLATGGDDCTVKIWRMDVAGLASSACVYLLLLLFSCFLSQLMGFRMVSSWVDMPCPDGASSSSSLGLRSNVRHSRLRHNALQNTPTAQNTTNETRKQHPRHNRSRTPTDPPRPLRRDHPTNHLPLQTAPLLRLARLDRPRLGAPPSFAHDLCPLRRLEAQGRVDRTYGRGVGFGAREG